jgi:hypothetical protein
MRALDRCEFRGGLVRMWRAAELPEQGRLLRPYGSRKSGNEYPVTEFSPELWPRGHVAELGRCEAGVRLEHGAEVTLVGEAAHQCDFG